VASAHQGKPCCVRCGDVMIAGPVGNQAAGSTSLGNRAVDSRTENRGVPEPAPAKTATQTVTLRAPLSGFDHWELEEQLRHVERVLSGVRFSAKVAPLGRVELPRGVQAAAQQTATRQTTAAASSADKGNEASVDDASVDDTARGRSKRRRFVHTRHATAPRSRWTWTTVTAGAAALACGIGLLVCGWLSRRPELQTIGLPITLLGQGAVLVGMLVQLDHVWRDNRRTDDKLSRFQRQLENLENLAADLQTVAPRRHGVSTPTTQQRTLADLKQRLETLSHRLNSPSS
jgi:hypothetical protein